MSKKYDILVEAVSKQLDYRQFICICKQHFKHRRKRSPNLSGFNKRTCDCKRRISKEFFKVVEKLRLQAKSVTEFQCNRKTNNFKECSISFHVSCGS